jgi:hypothetical protein
MICTEAAHAQQGPTVRSQVIYLPDPTPRPPDPHWLLGDDPKAGSSTQEAVEHRNQKRHELTLWAANELVTLSVHLQADVAQPKTSLNTADATANAQKIEQLAKNLATALRAP